MVIIKTLIYHRLVTLISVIGKLLDKLLKKINGKQHVEILKKQNMISSKQFGLKEGKLGVPNFLYLDFKKEFDKVLHNILIRQLEHVGGIKGKLLE